MTDPLNCSSRRACLGFALALIVLHCHTTSFAADPRSGLSFEAAGDRVVLTHSGKPVAEFVFRDPTISRPYIANVRLPAQRQVTRRHPPVAGMDATDHSEMHPGVWLGFGDINGHDFWRNKATIEHVRFSQPASVVDGRVSFATESKLVGSNGENLGRMQNHLTAEETTGGWRLTWQATFTADSRDLVFGDQEEMGFGARVATEMTEKNGGLIRSSEGLHSAKATWGKPAAWCDYSGTIDGTPCGITLMTSPSNFRASWWHNRDYGLVVANSFGRAAMKQGEKSQITLKQGEALRLVYAATFHEGTAYDSAKEYQAFTKSLKSSETP
jgi:hypothetical protein